MKTRYKKIKCLKCGTRDGCLYTPDMAKCTGCKGTLCREHCPTGHETRFQQES